MFCPNCGRNCGNESYCHSCGTNLLTGQISLSPPIRRFKGMCGYMDHGIDSVRFFKKVFLKKTVRIIPYSEIRAVTYQPAEKNGGGFLCVRSFEDRVPPITDYSYAISDESSIEFYYKDRDAVEKYYSFLKAHEAQNLAQRKWEHSGVPDKKDTPSHEELRRYYELYKPNREQAVAALRLDTGLDAVEANKLIDLVFYAKGDIPAYEKRKAELDAANQAYCPKCLSIDISVQKRGFDFKNARGLSIVEIFYKGKKGADSPLCICKKCGHMWEPNFFE